jgi:hypothetical protein
VAPTNIPTTVVAGRGKLKKLRLGGPRGAAGDTWPSLFGREDGLPVVLRRYQDPAALFRLVSKRPGEGAALQAAAPSPNAATVQTTRLISCAIVTSSSFVPRASLPNP